MRADILMLSGLLMLTGIACDADSDRPDGRGIVCDGVSLTGCIPGDDSSDSGNDSGGDATGEQPAPTEVCGYRTELQGSWGSVCAKDPLDKLRDAHFAALFPEGLYIGCGAYTGNLLTSAAVAAALPSAGEPRALLATEAVAYDGAGDPQVGTRLFGEVVALSLNLAFADLPAFNKAAPAAAFGDLQIADPDSPCVGMTVQQVLDEANLALGGCLAALSPAQVDECVAAINASFDDNDGKCPGKGGNANSVPGGGGGGDDDDEVCSDLYAAPIH